jgi:hypothetical protein
MCARDETNRDASAAHHLDGKWQTQACSSPMLHPGFSFRLTLHSIPVSPIDGVNESV